MSKEDSYEVGYGKPPRAHQFKPGSSGNPGGRKKAPKSLKDIVARQVGRKAKVKVNGRQRSMTQGQAVVQQLFDRALGGDVRAIREALALMRTEWTSGSETESTLVEIQFVSPDGRRWSYEDKESLAKDLESRSGTGDTDDHKS